MRGDELDLGQAFHEVHEVLEVAVGGVLGGRFRGVVGVVGVHAAVAHHGQARLGPQGKRLLHARVAQRDVLEDGVDLEAARSPGGVGEQLRPDGAPVLDAPVGRGEGDDARLDERGHPVVFERDEGRHRIQADVVDVRFVEVARQLAQRVGVADGGRHVDDVLHLLGVVGVEERALEAALGIGGERVVLGGVDGDVALVHDVLLGCEDVAEVGMAVDDLVHGAPRFSHGFR